MQGRPPSIATAFTSAPRLMSSSTASARFDSAARCRGVKPSSPSRPLTAVPFARCRSIASRSPASAATQIVDASAVAEVLLDLRGDDIAMEEIQFVAGTTVTMPANKGRNTRRKRCLTSAPRPRRCNSIALKKPLMTKKTGMRKPWMAEKRTPNVASCRVSATTQNDGKNERAACRAIPSSMATARRASRSDRRERGGFWSLMEDVRSASFDIESGLPGRTVVARRPGRPSPIVIRVTRAGRPSSGRRRSCRSSCTGWAARRSRNTLGLEALTKMGTGTSKTRSQSPFC